MFLCLSSPRFLRPHRLASSTADSISSLPSPPLLFSSLLLSSATFHRSRRRGLLSCGHQRLRHGCGLLAHQRNPAPSLRGPFSCIQEAVIRLPRIHPQAPFQSLLQISLCFRGGSQESVLCLRCLRGRQGEEAEIRVL